MAKKATAYVSVREAAKRLGLTNSDVDDLCEDGTLESASRRLVNVASLEAYADVLAAAPETS